MRRPAASWTTMSTGSERKRVAQDARSPRRLPMPSGSARSQAMPSASQEIALAPTAADAIFASGRDRRRAAGWEISVATSGMEKSGGEGAHQERDPDSRADRQRQVGAGARSRRAPRRRHRQHRFHAGLFGARRADGAAERRRARRAPHLLYGHVHPGIAYSTGAWLRDVVALVDGGTLSDAPPIFVGGTGLYFRALAEGISEMPDIPPVGPRPLALRTCGQGRDKLHRILMREDPRPR